LPTVLGGFAEFERGLIRARTIEGRERVKECGMKIGCKPKAAARQKREAMKCRDAGDATLAEIGRSYNVGHSTILRLAP
jgi:DNA invertase Pin-like site-specific DNA recombinase